MSSFERNSNSRSSGTSLYATFGNTTETLPEQLTLVAPSTTTATSQRQQERFTVPLPKIQYTVPGMKRGWKENGVWMDEDGPRNGPPQNFWRQMGDERVYNDSMQLVQDLLQLNNFEANGLGSSEQNADSGSNTNTNTNRLKDMMSGMAERLEKTNSIRIPSLNRLILGDWAPIVRGGKVVAASETSDNGEQSVSVPYRFYIQRTAGQKLAPKTHYGAFDEHLEPEEEITVQELSGSNTVTSSGVAKASGDKNELRLVKGYSNPNGGDLYMGGITHVTKYIMIMKRQPQQQEGEDDAAAAKGPVTEIWMKVDGLR